MCARVVGVTICVGHLHLHVASPLYLLCRHKKCVQKLLEHGADISIHDNEGLTAVRTHDELGNTGVYTTL